MNIYDLIFWYQNWLILINQLLLQMKKLTLFSLFIALMMVSCSKCYDCVETHNILDANGNVIDQTEVHEDVCTSSSDEIEKRESQGAVCS